MFLHQKINFIEINLSIYLTQKINIKSNIFFKSGSDNTGQNVLADSPSVSVLLGIWNPSVGSKNWSSFLRKLWLTVCFVSAASQYLSSLGPPVCVCLWASVSAHDWWCSPPNSTPPKHTGLSSGQWFPLMAPSGEGAGRNEQEKEGQKEGRKSIDFLKGGTGQDVGG